MINFSLPKVEFQKVNRVAVGVSGVLFDQDADCVLVLTSGHSRFQQTPYFLINATPIIKKTDAHNINLAILN
jgi:hypothetical protein